MGGLRRVTGRPPVHSRRALKPIKRPQLGEAEAAIPSDTTGGGIRCIANHVRLATALQYCSQS
jgi:hypothetical protein